MLVVLTGNNDVNVYSPTRLALGVLTYLEELVAAVRAPGSAARLLSSLLSSLGSARFP